MAHGRNKQDQLFVELGGYTISRDTSKNGSATYIAAKRIGGGRSLMTWGHSWEEVENLLRHSGLSDQDISSAGFYLELNS